MERLKPREKRFKMPGSTVILFWIICFVAVLTYIVPAGQFDTVVNESTGASVVDPATFHEVEHPYVKPTTKKFATFLKISG